MADSSRKRPAAETGAGAGGPAQQGAPESTQPETAGAGDNRNAAEPTSTEPFVPPPVPEPVPGPDDVQPAKPEAIDQDMAAPARRTTPDASPSVEVASADDAPRRRGGEP